MGEFEIIERYFRSLQPRGEGILTGIGDDGAVLAMPPGRQLVAALDTLVEGVHFPAGSAARSIGHRALAVNLSDLAAMGAEPAWFLLSLTLPAAEEGWLSGFAQGLGELAVQAGIALVGGDTTRGPLSVSLQALGLIEPGQALTRDGAKPGDLLFVSGNPGDAAAGLALLQGGSLHARPQSPLDGEAARQLVAHFEFPAPRLALGRALRGLASACIDVSDGLVADAGKLAAASRCGARIECAELPLSPALRSGFARSEALRLALAGGDDYELCFSLPPSHLPELAARAAAAGTAVRCIGVIESTPGVAVFEGGARLDPGQGGFEHFSAR